MGTNAEDPEVRYQTGLMEDRAGNESKAIEHYLYAAEKGYAEAQSMLATKYLYGEGVKRDPEEALKWLRAAEAQGDLLAYVVLGEMYFKGEDVPWNIERAIRYFEAAKDSDRKIIATGAYFYLGSVYLEEDGYKDFEKAEKYLKRAAELGDEDSVVLLGRYYEGELDGEEDWEKALEWYEEAAEMGSSVAAARVQGFNARREKAAEEKELKNAREEARRKLAELDLTEEEVQSLDKVLVLGKQHFDRLVVKWGYRGRGGTNKSGYSCERKVEVDLEDLKGREVRVHAAPELYGYTLGEFFGVSAIVDDFVYSSEGDVFDMREPYEEEMGFQIDTEWVFTVTPFRGPDPVRAIPCVIKELMREAGSAADENDPEEVKRFLTVLEKEGEAAPERYKKLKDANAPTLCMLLAESYGTGMYGLEKDEGKAAELYKRAAEKDDPDACARLGDIYRLGQGVPKDAGAAYDWYMRALESHSDMRRGTAVAWVGLGMLCYMGEGTRKDLKRAFLLWGNAAESDFPVERAEALELLENR